MTFYRTCYLTLPLCVILKQENPAGSRKGLHFGEPSIKIANDKTPPGIITGGWARLSADDPRLSCTLDHAAKHLAAHSCWDSKYWHFRLHSIPSLNHPHQTYSGNRDRPRTRAGGLYATLSLLNYPILYMDCLVPRGTALLSGVATSTRLLARDSYTAICTSHLLRVD